MKDFLGKFLKVFLIAALASALFGAAAFAAVRSPTCSAPPFSGREPSGSQRRRSA